MNWRASRGAAWGAMLLIVVVIIIAVCTRFVSSIWEYSALFLGFMAVFCHLAAVLLSGMSLSASRKLDNIALIFGVLTILDIVAIFIVDFCGFY